MSLIFTRQRVQRDLGDTSTQLVPPRARGMGNVMVSTDTALRHSAVWACLRLRADLVSTMPTEVFRNVGGMQLQAAPTPFLTDPGGDGSGIEDWLYSSQFELDRSGNAIGIIRARDAMGYPAVVELVAREHVIVRGKGPQIQSWLINGRSYTPDEVWHERQFTVPGIPLGLSPIAYAAMSVGQYLSAQQFALDWFSNGRVPAGQLKNTAKTIDPTEADIAKRRFRAAMESRDIFVTGVDWEYNLLGVQANESQFVETMNYGVVDMARFFGVPGDLIDAPTLSSAKITYANITQRNLQLLVMNLLPTLVRRERKLSTALPRPRYVQFDPAPTLLRMDPATKQQVTASMIQNRQLTPDEARDDDNRPPLTDEQMAQFLYLFGTKVSQPAAPGVPVPPPGGPNDQ